jgi:hypothetical protein
MLRLAVSATAALIVVLALLQASDDAGTDERSVAAPPPWTHTIDPKRGFTLSLPPSWEAATESLTPDLGDPREVLSVGTFPLRYRAGACSHMPAGALATMGPADGFVTIQERGRDPGSKWTEFRRRPARFADVATPARTDVDECVEGRHVVFWIPFTDAGRHFYVLVVLGVQAPADVRAQAFEILDHLRFDPSVQPTWRSSG